MMQTLSSSETSVLTRATQRNIPDDAIIYSNRRENLKSYMDHISVLRWILLSWAQVMELFPVSGHQQQHQ
jgi:hypothetical protein